MRTTAIIVFIIWILVVITALAQFPPVPGAGTTNPPVFHDTPYPPRSRPPTKPIVGNVRSVKKNSIAYWTDGRRMDITRKDSLSDTNWVAAGTTTNGVFTHGGLGFYKLTVTNACWIVPEG